MLASPGASCAAMAPLCAGLRSFPWPHPPTGQGLSKTKATWARSGRWRERTPRQQVWGKLGTEKCRECHSEAQAALTSSFAYRCGIPKAEPVRSVASTPPLRGPRQLHPRGRLNVRHLVGMHLKLGQRCPAEARGEGTIC